ncbi:hypothetical protein [Microbacterium deminutum]|uniref:Uncharacterized protein n=1 Tax=Microbacterium deminutum TaxID=344164 RepID=A0ABP5CG83_9MICO
MVDGNAAAQTMLGFGTNTPSHCLEFVWLAYKKNGASVDGWWATALDGWKGSSGKHEGDLDPPAGVPVWWGERPGSNAGDVVISLGGGRVVATDFPTFGRIGTATIAERQNQVRRTYLGWTETILGVPIDGIAEALLPQRPKEKHMSYSLVPQAHSEKIFVVSLITGMQAHILNPHHLMLLNRVQKNEFNDAMLLAELSIVRGYLTAINPPPDVVINPQALADALSSISEDVDPSIAENLVNEAITANSTTVEKPGDGLNNRL